jgi:hypothetical protein
MAGTQVIAEALGERTMSARLDTPPTRMRRPTRLRPGLRGPHRRGVASVLAMMFLVIFGSLGIAMAIVAQGNLRTADSAIKVSRAMSAAETGLIFAARRLESEGKRFVVRKGVIDTDFASKLWNGTWNAATDGEVIIEDAVGYDEEDPVDSLAEAIRNAHAADANTLDVEAGDGDLPAIDEEGQLDTRAVRVISNDDRVWFRLTYEPVPGQPAILVRSVGADGDIRRTLEMEFRINKRIEYAVITPNRLMIGKNVLISGPLATRFGTEEGELNSGNGNPLVMRSDFYYLSDELDTLLDEFYEAVALYDVDGDARLRPGNSTEQEGIALNGEFIDRDGDEYVNDFDMFLGIFDNNGDGRVVYDATKATVAGLGNLDEEFADVDNQLGWLIDKWDADRNDDNTIDVRDTGLGYDDGVINALDRYAKVTGRLAFGVTQDEWETAQGKDYQTIVLGPIWPEPDDAPVTFGVPEEEMRVVTTAMFADSAAWFKDEADGDFAAQTASGGLTIAQSSDTWEPVPYGSSAAYDWYQRVIYQNYTFTNVTIPTGTNAVFENCTFVGVTYVETSSECIDVNWNYAGSIKQTVLGGGSVIYSAKFPGLQSSFGGAPVADTKVLSNSLRFNNCTFLGSLAGDTPNEYTHWRNKIQLTGQTRFYLDSTDPELLEQEDSATLVTLLDGIDDADKEMLARSSIMLPGWSVDVGNFNNEQAEDPEDTARVKLRGTIIAGILDVRGTADVHGTLLMTFRPVAGQGPLFYDGQPDMFNTTIGYFGPLDGDGEGHTPDEAGFEGFGEITLRYNPDAKLPDGIPWPISIEAQSATYHEGKSSS